MASIAEVEKIALEITASLQTCRKWAHISAGVATAIFLGGLVFSANDATRFSRWGAIGIAIALIWNFYWSSRLSKLQNEYAFGLRSSGNEFLMRMTSDDVSKARTMANDLSASIPRLAAFVLFVEIAMTLISTIIWGYGDLLLCKVAKWEVTSC